MHERYEILYLAAGGPQSTSMMKAAALERLGHDVYIVNLSNVQARSIWMRRLDNWTGYAMRQNAVGRYLQKKLPGRKFDVGWVDSGQMVGPGVIKMLRGSCRRVINYNHDDPTGKRDGKAWWSFKKSVPLYDALVTVRRETEGELKKLGAKSVMRVWRSYDELEHRPINLTTADHERWGSEIIFVGTWMPERGPFMSELLRRGLPLAIYGDFWEKAPEWPELRRTWRGTAVYGEDYRKAIQCSKIALGLLSKGNRDLHTTRTMEIPAMGALLCAERTEEHLQLFRDGEEVALFSDIAECGTICSRLLKDQSAREAMRSRGHEKILRLGVGNEDMLARVLAEVQADQRSRNRQDIQQALTERDFQ